MALPIVTAQQRLAEKKGSSRFTGERSLDLQKEIG